MRQTPAMTSLIPARSLVRAAASVAGMGAGAALTAWGLARRTKPLHSRGWVCDATLVIDAPPLPEVPLLARPGRYAVTCRVSRAVSLGDRGVDVAGLAVRIPSPPGGQPQADLLFASTGSGRWTRYVLIPTRRTEVVLTTLWPMRAGDRLVWWRLGPQGAGRWTVDVAVDDEPWRAAGTLTLGVPETDRPLRFDPLGSIPTGLTYPDWMRALRAPAYTWARAAVPTPRLPGLAPPGVRPRP